MATCPVYLTGYVNGIYYYATIDCAHPTAPYGTIGSSRPLQCGCTPPNPDCSPPLPPPPPVHGPKSIAKKTKVSKYGLLYRDADALEAPLDPADFWLQTLPLTVVASTDLKFRPASTSPYIACRLFKVTIEAHNGIDRDLLVLVGQELGRIPIGLSATPAVHTGGKKYKLTHGGEDYSVLLS